MMNIVEEAIIYATVMHQGKRRKFQNNTYILHPLEVAQILSTMTDDEEIISAGILHDVVEDTDGTLEEIRNRFGERVAFLVSSETENKYPGEDPGTSWKRRKEESLRELKNSPDIGVRMLWLADKLSNIRSLAGLYAEHGEEVWETFNQKDPELQRWYYRSIAEILEISLNRTGAFKEFIKHVNSIWPGSFDSEKARYKKYKEVSLEGCRLLGYGAKGEVYRYNDELVIKVFNLNNTFHDVEQEIALSRRAFILGIPTAISFGIVSVGDRYGAMYELMDSDPVSRYIAASPGQVANYAKVMADLAKTIHGTKVSKEDGFPDGAERLRRYIRGGIGREDAALAAACMALIDRLPAADTLIHGDFHTGNVFLQDGEPVLIDMDRVSMGHPIIELGDLYYFYVVLGEEDPSVVENYMGFSYQTAGRFFHSFLQYYLDTEEEQRLAEVTEKAALICYIRIINKIYKKESLSEKDREMVNIYRDRIARLTEKLDTLAF